MNKTEAVSKLIALAKGELGYREGANNYTKYAEEPMIQRLYGWKPQNQPWCCVFVNWCFLTAFGYDIGSRLTYGGTAACANSASLFRAKGALKTTPEVGDQAFYYSGGGINHTGIVVEVDGSSFAAIEGNYSDKVSEVRHTVGSKDVAGFGRPKWDLVASYQQVKPSPDTGTSQVQTGQKPVADQEDHSWKPPLLRQSDTYKPDVVVLQALLNVKGFPCGEADGYYGPKTATAVSRAQHYYGIAQDCICGPETWKRMLKTEET